MKTLYFDCSSGISGNMVLGALTELTGDREYLVRELEKLHIDGYRIEYSSREKNGIMGTHVDVILDDQEKQTHHHDHEHHHSHEHPHEHHHDHDHEHHHEHHHGHEHGHGPHRNLDDINAIIDRSDLNEETKALAKRIFLRVAEAESKVHGKPLSQVHFHEVGATDSIVDIVGTAILIDRIRPEQILSGVVNEGHGFIHCAHGTMAVPVPATSEIFAKAKVRFRQIDIDTELVTPTGAAIIAELAGDYIPMPAMQVSKVGWGAGSKSLSIPNLLKVTLGETSEQEDTAASRSGQGDRSIVVMETNIDDTSGEILGHTMDQLLKKGALDVFYTPVYMKKNRPAYRLTVTCRKEDMDLLQSCIFRETTTIGIRYRYEDRVCLDREQIFIDTPYGTIEAKKVIFNGEAFIYPEYESLKKTAEQKGVPLKDLYRMAGTGRIKNDGNP